jgi:hypothetical protein
MKNLLKILWREQEGQDLTEYALITSPAGAWRYHEYWNAGKND